jgi:pilus assembly protein FimV
MLASTMESPTLELPDPSSATADMPILDESALNQLSEDDSQPDDSALPDDGGTLDVDLSGLADFADSDEPADPKMDIDSTLNQLDNTGEFLKPEDVEGFSKTFVDDDDLSAAISDNDVTQLSKTGDFPDIEDSSIGDNDSTQLAKTGNFPDIEGFSDGDTVAQSPPDGDADGDTAEQPKVTADDQTDFGDAPQDGAIPGDATMTEVGTKLDLARAYIDMGDPDGARSILNEVLDEGGDSQQQEANQLLEELGD